MIDDIMFWIAKAIAELFVAVIGFVGIIALTIVLAWILNRRDNKRRI